MRLFSLPLAPKHAEVAVGADGPGIVVDDGIICPCDAFVTERQVLQAHIRE